MCLPHASRISSNIVFLAYNYFLVFVQSLKQIEVIKTLAPKTDDKIWDALTNVVWMVISI